MAELIGEREEELRRLPRNRDATFNDAADAWLLYVEHEKRVKPSTLRDHRMMLAEPVSGRENGPRARIRRTFRDSLLGDIRPADIARFLSALDRSGVSARTVNKYRQILRSVFEYARRDDGFGLVENPVDATEKRREAAPAPIDTFELEEIAAIARAAQDGLHRDRQEANSSEGTEAEWQRINDQDAALFTIAAFTGLRLGELVALRWGDVDFGAARLTIARTMSAGELAASTKSGRIRIVPLSDQVAAELAPLSQRELFTTRDDFVFCRADGGPLDRTAVRKRFARAQKQAGVRVRRFHDLRHTFGSLAVRSFDPVAVQAMMGHSRLTTTERYLHTKPRTDDAARLSAAFDASQPESARMPARIRP
jgi:integrase